MVVKKQTTITKWIDNEAQKKLDIAWAETMFRAGIAFNFLNFGTTQTFHDAYLEIANARPKVKLSTYKHMRTVMLVYVYLKVQKALNPMTVCWDKTGCTFITDGSTDRKNRPVMNFLTAGKKGAVLVTTFRMTGRKKNAVTLAKLWEQIMREIGLQRINAICTDNAKVNKKAAQILERRTNRDVARIPWVPCGVHCCSLLLKDLSNLSWVKDTVKTATPSMDEEGVSPTNLVEFDDMIARKLSNVVLTKTEREDVMAKVNDRVKMMRQPAHAAAFLLDPRRRDPSWLNDPDNPLVQNAMRFLMRQIGRTWNSKQHVDMWDYLWKFLREPVEGEVRKDEHMWTDRAREGAMRRAPQDWWGLHGGDIPELQKIAIRVLGMWSTATPAERNWASMDFVHSKRRNSLSPESLEKLVYIHWNMQLLRVPDNKENGYVDTWRSFFEPLMEPTKEEQSVQEGTMDKTANNVEEEKRQQRLAKAPKGRVPEGLEDEDSTGSSDFEDLVCVEGKCWNEFTSDESDDEDDIGEDSDFELGAKPAVPATTYVNEEEAARAKVMADRDAALVQKRTQEEEAQRAAVPTRRERERQTSQVEKEHTHHLIDNVEEEADVHAPHEGCLQTVGEDLPGVKGEKEQREKNEEHEEEENLRQEGVHLTEAAGEQCEEQGKELRQPPPAVYTRRLLPPTLQRPATLEEHQDQQAVVGEKRQELQAAVRGAAHHIAKPPYPAENEDAQHDNLWKSRAGRKRKAPVDEVPAKPRRDRDRPPNPKAGDNARKKKQRGACRRHKVEVAEDDPSSDEGVGSVSDGDLQCACHVSTSDEHDVLELLQQDTADAGND
ncbi:hypothetical protein CBR_g39591 [Chara braunii]|uniref:DUF659 domain-containing protein n=1 Tax=Chara braunii TaxID=69332 RepID=A0A388K196_CHABU|nr:hypothetical protein CBR_g39591 [Chara braunii]|eukprot:GBG63807.1 hypothetical protein CBR_g39591 [Chara braunii]